MGHNDINFKLNQFGCQLGQPVVLSIGPAELESKVFSPFVAELAQACTKRVYAPPGTGIGPEQQ